ncbi:MAG: hypothetical protein ACYS99_22400, partial [Planctomycetota bacterium]
MAEGREIRLELVRGPLREDALARISATYGRHNGRFLDVAFCHALYNENPVGSSIHCFAWDGDTLIGHYSLIPMRMRDRGEALMAGRGEAAFVDEKYRREPVEVEGKRRPCGMAMMHAVWGRGFAEGVELIYITTTP